jgi:hypothetical protein
LRSLPNFNIFQVRKLNDSDANQRINKSIFVLITIYLLLWSISILFSSILIPNSTLDPQSKVFLSRLFVQLNRLATALNAPVLYFCRYSKTLRKLIFNICFFLVRNIEHFSGKISKFCVIQIWLFQAKTMSF